jgi:CubicO group peptidase (beta-lactamase class C family)
MTAGFSRLARFSTPLLSALVLWIFFGFTRLAPAQSANLPTPASLTATLAEKYPTLRALVLARGNCTVFEYYRGNIDAETQSAVHSVTKSVLSILVGIAVDEGYLRLDEKLPEIIPEAFDETVDAHVRDITVREILTKTEGFAEQGMGNIRMSPSGGIWRWMLNRPMRYSPGTHFRYDNVGSDLLSVVLSKALKQESAKFAQQKLFGPLQITNYRWPSDSEGFLHGESGLFLTARDMAKIGLLYLRHGRWGDRQIVSEAYVRDSTTRHNDGGPPVKRAGYGYQWWVNTTKTNLDAFFAAGHLSQLIYVVPGLDLVAAVSADGLRGGSTGLIDDVVIPAEADLPASASCIAELGPGRSQ